MIDEAATAADGAITSARCGSQPTTCRASGTAPAGRYARAPADAAGWHDEPRGDRHRVRALSRRGRSGAGGAVRRLFDKHAAREVLRAGGLRQRAGPRAGVLGAPQFNEGPWHLVPTGAVLARSTGSRRPSPSGSRASPLGHRLVVTGRLGSAALHADDHPAARQRPGRLPHHGGRVRRAPTSSCACCWPADVPGALPASDVGSAAVVGRGFALPRDGRRRPSVDTGQPGRQLVRADLDSARAHQPARGVRPIERAIGIAELVAADRRLGGRTARARRRARRTGRHRDDVGRRGRALRQARRRLQPA